jgi:predicted MPP superfamily phosphohydrolase
MKCVKLLQVGDIHFPEARERTFADLKDDAFPASVSSKVTIRPLQNIVRKIANQCDSGIDGILFCGDLTSKGSIDGYKKCIQYLTKFLEIDNPTKWPPAHFHVVPGNHDVCRDLCNSTDDDLLKKFEPLRSAWKDVKLAESFTFNFRRTDLVSREGCRAALFSLNSCIGCGEIRQLPKEIRHELAEVLKNYESTHGLEKAFDVIGEKLDTPAFIVDDIDKVYYDVNSLDDDVIPIVLAHHNILPQVLPRISIYTEVLNAGVVRSRLSKCSRPVIYCHGHIHANPIELVSQSGHNKHSGLTCVAATELLYGFNIITIEYAKNGIPIGCIVDIFGIQDDGSVDKLKSERISLQLSRNAEKVCSADTLTFLSCIPADFTRFGTALDEVRKRVGANIHKRTLADALLEAEWLGIVEIVDRDDNNRHWQVRRFLP